MLKYSEHRSRNRTLAGLDKNRPETSFHFSAMAKFDLLLYNKLFIVGTHILSSTFVKVHSDFPICDFSMFGSFQFLSK